MQRTLLFLMLGNLSTNIAASECLMYVSEFKDLRTNENYLCQIDGDRLEYTCENRTKTTRHISKYASLAELARDQKDIRTHHSFVDLTLVSGLRTNMYRETAFDKQGRIRMEQHSGFLYYYHKYNDENLPISGLQILFGLQINQPTIGVPVSIEYAKNRRILTVKLKASQMTDRVPANWTVKHTTEISTDGKKRTEELVGFDGSIERKIAQIVKSAEYCK